MPVSKSRTAPLLAATLLIAATADAKNPAVAPHRTEEAQMLDAALNEAMGEMMKPGPVQAGWDKGGVDLGALVAATPGGAAKNYVLSIDSDGARTITIIGGGSNLARIVPPDWQAVTSIGTAPSAGGGDDLSIGKIGSAHYFAGTASQRRVGDSFCAEPPTNGVLYKDPNKTESELPDAMVQAMFEMVVKRFDATTFCWRHDRDGEGYRIRYFLPDGRTLPGLDAMQERLSIVPAASLPELLDAPAAKAN